MLFSRRLALFLGLLLTFPWPAWAQGAFGIPFFTAHYVLNKFGVDAAETTLSFQPDGKNKVIYTQTTHAIGIFSWFFHQKIIERSILPRNSKIPLPIEFTYSETGGGKNVHARIVFDRKALIATGVDRQGRPVHVKIQPDTVDFLSIQLALIQAVAEHKKNLNFTVVQSANKLSHYDFTYAGEKRIHTPLGELNTIVVQRFRGHKDRYDFYLAPRLHYLPVRLVQTKLKDDSKLTLNLRSVQWNDPAEPANHRGITTQ